MLRQLTHSAHFSRPTAPLLIRTLASSSLPKTQKAVVVNSYGGELEYRDIPVPQPGPNDILVNILYSGVCNSDYHTWKGDWTMQAPLPVILGHEGAGVVVSKGSNVTNFEVGDYAGVKWLNSTCNACEYCESGWETVCPSQTTSGFTKPGTFQQYCVADAVQAAHIPKDVDLPSVAPMLCAGITVYRALKEAQIKAGEWIAIIGAGGGLGSLGVQFGKAMGFKVLGIDSSKKKAYMSEKGVDAIVCFDETKDLAAEVLAVTKGGAHAVVNVTSNEKAYNDALAYVRPTGTLVLVGVPGGNSMVRSPILKQVSSAITTKGSVLGNRKDTREVIDFFRAGKVTSPVNVVGMSQIADVFAKMERGEIFGRYVVDTSK